MATIAIYNMKGGVGKTTVAVNLAWAAATQSGMRTLLWDLDAQAASSFILGGDAPRATEARSLFEGRAEPADAIVATSTAGLDLLPADRSLRTLDAVLQDAKGARRLARLLATLSDRYDCVILDCPPGLGPTGEQILRGASVILVPMIPSTLSVRACDEVCEYVGEVMEQGPPIFPIFTMVDRRRTAHRLALAADPTFPTIPTASAVEMMGDRHAPVGAYAPRSPAALAFLNLWSLVEPHARTPRAD